MLPMPTWVTGVGHASFSACLFASTIHGGGESTEMSSGEHLEVGYAFNSSSSLYTLPGDGGGSQRRNSM